jgi:hypothetical protein
MITPPSAGTAECAECQAIFEADAVISLDGKFVCALCKPIYLHKLIEGVCRPALSFKSRRKVALLAGIALLCSIAVYALCALYVARQPAPEPPWSVFALAVPMLVGIGSVAVLITSVLFRWYRKQ